MSPECTWRAIIKRKRIILGLILAVIAIAVVLYLYLRPKPTETEVAISAISKHMVLPNNEEPAVLTIVDKTKVTSPFLKKAANGDKVLVYQKTQRAIIYRPSIDRIVDVGPVIIDEIEDR